MTKTTKQNGGRREGAGRPVAGTKYVSVRLTPEQQSKLKALGGSEWIRARLDEVTTNQYRIIDAYNCDIGIEKAILDCYVDALDFEAADDAAAVAKAEALQEKHDKAARKIIEKAEKAEDPDLYALEQSFEYAPCYTNCLERYDPDEDDWIRVEC